MKRTPQPAATRAEPSPKTAAAALAEYEAAVESVRCGYARHTESANQAIEEFLQKCRGDGRSPRESTFLYQMQWADSLVEQVHGARLAYEVLTWDKYAQARGKDTFSLIIALRSVLRAAQTSLIQNEFRCNSTNHYTNANAEAQRAAVASFVRAETITLQNLEKLARAAGLDPTVDE